MDSEHILQSLLSLVLLKDNVVSILAKLQATGFAITRMTANSYFPTNAFHDDELIPVCENTFQPGALMLKNWNLSKSIGLSQERLHQY